MAAELEWDIGTGNVQRNGRNVRSITVTPSNGESAELQAARKQQLLELLASLVKRGRITPEEIAGILRAAHPSGRLPPPESVHPRMQELQGELRFERANNAFLEGEVTRLKTALAREHELVTEGLYRIASLERQITETRETTAKLVTASRDSLRSLQRAEIDLPNDGFDAFVLAPLTQNLRDVAQAALELHSVARARDATPATDVENR